MFVVFVEVGIGQELIFYKHVIKTMSYLRLDLFSVIPAFALSTKKNIFYTRVIIKHRVELNKIFVNS